MGYFKKGHSDKGHNRNNLRTKDKVQCTKWRLSYSNNYILNLQPLNKGQRTKWPENNGSQTCPLFGGFTVGLVLYLYRTNIYKNIWYTCNMIWCSGKFIKSSLSLRTWRNKWWVWLIFSPNTCLKSGTLAAAVADTPLLYVHTLLHTLKVQLLCTYIIAHTKIKSCLYWNL